VFFKLSLDQDYLSKMSNTDQAGFWLHEAIYRALRIVSKNTNSGLARFINAYIFSDAVHEILMRKFRSKMKILF